MRELRQRSIFKGDLKRECRGRYRAILTKGGDFHRTVDILRHDMRLPLPIKIMRFMVNGKAQGNVISGRTCFLCIRLKVMMY